MDGHAAAAEPRACPGSPGRASTSAASSATATASCSPAGPSSARSSRSAATTPRKGTLRAGAVGVRRAVGDASAATCCGCGCGCSRTSTRCSRSATAPARRSCARCCSSIPTTRRPTRPTTSSCSATSLLVAPITRPGIEHRHVYLPAGTWVHWWTGERIDGPAHVLAHAPLGQPALYARANTPIPLWPELETTAGAPPDTLTWFVHAVAGAPAGQRRAVRGRGRRLRRERAPHRDARRPTRTAASPCGSPSARAGTTQGTGASSSRSPAAAPPRSRSPPAAR